MRILFRYLKIIYKKLSLVRYPSQKFATNLLSVLFFLSIRSPDIRQSVGLSKNLEKVKVETHF